MWWLLWCSKDESTHHCSSASQRPCRVEANCKVEVRCNIFENISRQFDRYCRQQSIKSWHTPKRSHDAHERDNEKRNWIRIHTYISYFWSILNCKYEGHRSANDSINKHSRLPPHACANTFLWKLGTHRWYEIERLIVSFRSPHTGNGKEELRAPRMIEWLSREVRRNVYLFCGLHTRTRQGLIPPPIRSQK